MLHYSFSVKNYTLPKKTLIKLIDSPSRGALVREVNLCRPAVYVDVFVGFRGCTFRRSGHEQRDRIMSHKTIMSQISDFIIVDDDGVWMSTLSIKGVKDEFEFRKDLICWRMASCQGCMLQT